MKEAINGSWVYITVLIFMVILIAYVSISINYSRSFEYSSNIIKSIESHDGLNSTSLKEISNYMHNNGHTTKGACRGDYYGVRDETVYKEPGTGRYDFCIRRDKVIGDDGIVRCYYETQVYFSFSLPVLGDLFMFQIPGQTAGMRYTRNDPWGACEN